MVIRRRSWFALVFVAVVTLTGCQSAGTGDEPGTTDASRTSSSTPAPSGTTCAVVATQGEALGTAVSQFIDGSASADQVRTAAADLSDALTEAAKSAEADAATAFDDVKLAVDRLLTALQTQPVDRAGVRSASADVLSALGEAVAVCEPAPTS